MLPKPRVLIVDQSAEVREVLRTALGGQVDIYEASRADEGLALARQHAPDLLVLDAETSAASSEAITQGLSVELHSRSAPTVLLGKLKRLKRSFPRGQFIAKPYHYGPLIRKIEALLGGSEQPLSRSA